MAKMDKILITGASGLVGSALLPRLKELGFEINILSRKKKESAYGQVYEWDVESGSIENGAFDGVNIVIHLAGAAVADKKWTSLRKKEILESRTESTALLRRKIKDKGIYLKSFVSASAIGYYGFDTGDNLCNENSEKGNGFLADVVDAWEGEIFELSDYAERVVALRIGMVLSEHGGALPKLSMPFKLGVGSPIGSGKQYMSWIHLDDLVEMFLTSVEKKSFNGIYNAVAPTAHTNRAFSKVLAKTLSRPFFLPPVPAFMLKLILGEMSSIVLGGNKVSAQRIIDDGYVFKYGDLTDALIKCLVTSAR